MTDFCLTIFFVHHIRLTIESNPLLQNITALIIFKLMAMGTYLVYYMLKGEEKQFRTVSFILIFLYLACIISASAAISLSFF